MLNILISISIIIFSLPYVMLNGGFLRAADGRGYIGVACGNEDVYLRCATMVHMLMLEPDWGGVFLLAALF